MTDERIKELIDQHVDAIVRFRLVQLTIENESEQEISMCEYLDHIHIDSGIYQVANALGKKVNKQFREGGEYPYYYNFVYRDLKIFQISEKPLAEENIYGK